MSLNPSVFLITTWHCRRIYFEHKYVSVELILYVIIMNTMKLVLSPSGVQMSGYLIYLSLFLLCFLFLLNEVLMLIKCTFFYASLHTNLIAFLSFKHSHKQSMKCVNWQQPSENTEWGSNATECNWVYFCLSVNYYSCIYKNSYGIKVMLFNFIGIACS